MEGFLVFGLGGGVGDDSGADVVVGEALRFFVNEGADHDAELGFAIESEVAEGAGVKSAWGGLEFGDDFAGALFRCTGDGTSGRTAGEGVKVGEAFIESAGDGGDEVMDLGERFELGESIDGNAAELANAPEVVAKEVGDHEELGHLLFGGLEFVRGAEVAGGVVETGAGAFDGAGLDAVARESEKELGGGGENLAVTGIEVGRHGRGGSGAQFFVIGEKALGADGGLEALGEVDLVDVSGGDVVFSGGDDTFEILAREVALPFSEGWRGGEAHFLALTGEVLLPDFVPFFGVVGIEKEIAVESEPELAFVIDGADPSAKRETGVGARELGGAISFAKVGEVSGVVEVARNDALGVGSDDGMGGVGVLREIAGGIEKDGILEMAQLVEDIDGGGVPRQGVKSGRLCFQGGVTLLFFRRGATVGSELGNAWVEVPCSAS